MTAPTMTRSQFDAAARTVLGREYDTLSSKARRGMHEDAVAEGIDTDTVTLWLQEYQQAMEAAITAPAVEAEPGNEGREVLQPDVLTQAAAVPALSPEQLAVEAGVLAQCQAILDAADPAILAHAQLLYPTVHPDCEGMSYTEFLSGVVESLPMYLQQCKNLPPSAEAFDAWMDGPEQEQEQADDAQAIAAATQNTAEQESALVDALLAEAAKEAKLAVASVRKGEGHYRACYVQAGLHCHNAIRAKLQAKHSRTSAVQLLEGQMAAYSSQPVDANLLVRGYWAWKLLAEDQGLAKAAHAVTWSAMAKGWALLVQSSNMGSPTESYTLLPGAEGRCSDLFKSGVEAGWSVKDTTTNCSTLVATLQREREAAESAARERAELEGKAAEQQRNQAMQERLAAAEAASIAEEQAKRLESEGKNAQAQAALEKAMALREQQAEQNRQAIAAQAVVDAKRREEQAAKERQEQAARAAAKHETKTAPKPATNGTTAAPKTGKEPGGVTNLLELAGQWKGKDTAEVCAQFVNRCSEPDTAVEQLLTLLVASKELCTSTKDGLEWALKHIRNTMAKPATLPVAAPSTNGHVPDAMSVVAA